MHKDEDQAWTAEIDLDRVRATPGGIVGGWVVVAVMMALMLILPPTISTADTALLDAAQGITKVEYQLAQIMPRFIAPSHRC